MYTAIQSKFSEALAKQSLVFTESTEIRKTLSSGIDVIYTLAPALAKKPLVSNQSDAAANGKAEYKPSTAHSSPWLPPDEDLVVEKGEEYTVVLNKFALRKYHFLLVTNKFVRQSSPLTEDDWAAAYKLLRAVNKESGHRYVGFFNCGSQSGASIGHKHIQFMQLPENFRPFPDSTEKVDQHGAAAADKRVPFAHYIAGISKDASAEVIALRYSELLGRVLTCVSRANPGKKRPEVNYNLVFTEGWILATPRKAAETSDGISINSLGTIGLLIAKSDQQLELLESKGLETVEELGFHYEDVKEYAPDFTGYTHY